MTTTRREIAEVNGARIYHEVRGSGPAVLLIVGATGDAGWYEQLADALADEFTVVSYDRRGNSRSPRPEGWTTTSMDEQADDARALVESLGLGPVAAFGSSAGGVVLLRLIERHSGTLRGAIVHEPPLVSVLPFADDVNAQLATLVQQGMAAGGPRGAMEAFVRVAAGEDAMSRLPGTLARALDNGELFFSTEIAAFTTYTPDPERLRATGVPIAVGAGQDNADPAGPLYYLYAATQWLAGRLEVDMVEFPGAHVPYVTHPQRTAELLRPILRKFS